MDKRWRPIWPIFWLLGSQEQPVGRVQRLFHIRIAQRGQEGVERGGVLGWHLHAHEDAAIVGALVAVVKQADVPGRLHQAQKLEQRAGPLGEGKAHQPLVLRQRRMPAHQVAQMLLGQFVVRQVQCLEAVAAEVLGDFLRLALAIGGDAHEHMGLGGIADAVVELGHVARATRQAAHHLAKAAEAAAFFGDGGGQTASVSTVMKSSTRPLWAMRKVSSPTSLTAVPSENKPTSASVTRSCALTDWIMASESFICTPITLISGRTALM